MADCGALRNQLKVHFRYRDTFCFCAPSEAQVRPLCPRLLRAGWLLSAWCELRRDFRTFPPRSHRRLCRAGRSLPAGARPRPLKLPQAQADLDPQVSAVASTEMIGASPRRSARSRQLLLMS
jgi:predicted DNA-binding transcriptional regulator YafY